MHAVERAAALNRLTGLYIFMTAAFALGLWGILHYGNRHLRAREDLAGEWTLSPLPGTAGETKSLRVDQSGRFCTIHVGSGPTLRLKMVEDSTSADPTGAGMKTVRLTGAQGQLTFSGRSESWRLTAVGVLQGDWDARRNGR